MDPVTLQFLKYPDALHWGVEAIRLGDDEWGTWLHLPDGAKRWKGLRQMRPASPQAVICVPRDDWWVLHYNGGATDFSHFIDIATPAIWSENRVEAVDLDLDVIVNQDGTIWVDDEDEFALHQVELGYPVELVTSARAATDRIVDLVSRSEEPFFNIASGWLARA